MRNFKFSFVVFMMFVGTLVILAAGDDNCDWCYDKPVMAAKVVASGLLVMIGAVAAAIQYAKVESSMSALEGMPLLEPHEATDGVPFAGEAVIEPLNGKVLKSPYTQTDCVYFHSITEHYVQSGDSGRWKVTSNVAAFVPFLLKDPLGDLEVDLTNIDADFSSYPIKHKNMDMPDPKNSEIDALPMIKHASTLQLKPNVSKLNFHKGIRYSEFVLIPKTKVFAHGIVSKRIGRHVLHEHDRARLIISMKPRDQYVESFYQGNIFVYGSHVLIASGYSIALLAANYFFHLDSLRLFTFLILGNAFFLGSVVFTMYNRIITLYTRTENALADIESELKRRHDLIPNLLEVVKAYTTYEKDTLEFVTSLRAGLSFMPYEPKKIAPISAKVAVLVERYPQLKSDKLFSKLMQELVDTEERIAYSREFYNRTIRKYNTLVNQFPFLIIAEIFSFESRSFLQISRGEHTDLKTAASS